MTDNLGVTAFRPNLTAPWTQRSIREGMQGQSFVTIIDGRPDGNAPGSPLCQLGIVMENGKVSNPHVHREIDVYVRLEQCGPQGVLTLFGDELQHEEWLFAGDTLRIQPRVPHVAIYPRFGDAPTALAVETRPTPDPDHDVVPLPNLWGTLVQRLVELNLVDQVDLPAVARAAWDGLT